MSEVDGAASAALTGIGANLLDILGRIDDPPAWAGLLNEVGAALHEVLAPEESFAS